MATFLFTDITCDLPSEYASRADFEILPFSFTLGSDSYDNIHATLTTKEFYARMRAGELATTSMLSQYLCEQKLEERLQQGYDVLYLVFSSALSGTFNVADRTAKELAQKYPDRKIRAIDTRNASLGEGLYVDYVLRKRNAGASFDELVAYAESLTDHLCSYFTVDDLRHLARLGRVSKTAAFIGEMAQIKPVLYVNRLGELVPIAKVLSRKKSLKALVDKMQDKMLPANEQHAVFIGHGDCEQDAQTVADMVRERFGITNIRISDIGPVIGAHTNAGVVALFFLGEDKVEAKDARVQ